MRKREGSVVCPSCGYLVGVNDSSCYNCGRRNPGLWGFSPALRSIGNINFSQVVIGTCILLYLLSLALSRSQGMGNEGVFGMLSPNSVGLFVFGASGATPVFEYGRWWTLLSASWLHGGVLHILFNMLWIRDLAPAVSSLYGSSRMVILYVVAGVVGFTMSTLVGQFLPLPGPLRGAQLTVGASASIFGLLAALVFAERRGVAGVFIGQQAKMWAAILFVFGFIMPGVDNWAHLGGFIGGFVGSSLLNPMRRERLDHMIAALVLVGLTAVAIVWSVVKGLPMIR